MSKEQDPNAYYLQANYFMRSAHLASTHRSEQTNSNSPEWNNFEAVIVGTSHAFAVEILLKGIMVANTGSFDRGHALPNLLRSEKCGPLYLKIEAKFNQLTTGSLKGKNFGSLLENHSKMFEKMRYACERTPPPLNMDFTSFLCEQLSHELKILCQNA